MVPSSTVPLAEKREAADVRLLDALDDTDDVQDVCANDDIDVEVLAALEE